MAKSFSRPVNPDYLNARADEFGLRGNDNAGMRKVDGLRLGQKNENAPAF